MTCPACGAQGEPLQEASVAERYQDPEYWLEPEIGEVLQLIQDEGVEGATDTIVRYSEARLKAEDVKDYLIRLVLH